MRANGLSPVLTSGKVALTQNDIERSEPGFVDDLRCKARALGAFDLPDAISGSQMPSMEPIQGGQ